MSEPRFFTHSSGARYVLRSPSASVRELYQVMPDGTEKFLSWKRNNYCDIHRISPSEYSVIDKITGRFTIVKDRGWPLGCAHGRINKNGCVTFFEKTKNASEVLGNFFKRILYLATKAK